MSYALKPVTHGMVFGAKICVRSERSVMILACQGKPSVAIRSVEYATSKIYENERGGLPPAAAAQLKCSRELAHRLEAFVMFSSCFPVEHFSPGFGVERDGLDHMQANKLHQTIVDHDTWVLGSWHSPVGRQ